MVMNNHALTLFYMGRVRDAQQEFETLITIQESAGLTLYQAHTQSNLGDAYLQLGDYRRALQAFERANQLLDSEDALTDQLVNLRQMADAYLSLNLFDEALSIYRKVETKLAELEMPHQQAWTQWGMGSTLCSLFQLEEASRVLEGAAQLFAGVKNQPLLAAVMLEQSALQETQGDLRGGLETAQQALTLIEDRDLPVQKAFVHLRIADLLLAFTVRDSDADEAEFLTSSDIIANIEGHLETAKLLVERLPLPHLRYRLNQRFGRLRILQNRSEEAEQFLQTAVNEIEQLRSTLTKEVLRTSFLHDKVDVYQDLVSFYLARDDGAHLHKAFDVAERARSRGLVELLTSTVETQARTMSDEQGHRNRLRSLHADLNALYNTLLRDGNPPLDDDSYPAIDQQRTTYMAELRQRVQIVEQEIRHLQLRIAALDETPDPFANPITLSEFQAGIPSDQVVLTYQILQDEVVVFVIHHEQTDLVRKVTTQQKVQDLVRKLNTHWDTIQSASAFVERHMDMLERTAKEVLHMLYLELFAPVEALLRQRLSQTQETPHQLILIPHGVVHQVPFQALFDGQHYLLERFELSYAPSATVLIHCSEQQPEGTGGQLIMGVSAADIPAVELEVQVILQELQSSRVYRAPRKLRSTTHRAEIGQTLFRRVYVDKQATVELFRQNAGDCGLIHLACHGIYRADNPNFSALQFTDGWLTAADIAQISFPGSLVVLSACESARNLIFGGDELIGLTRAFLGAGATTLVASQWLVQDEAGAILMAEWYARLTQGEETVAALRNAQLALKASHPHPYYWANFILSGSRSVVVRF